MSEREKIIRVLTSIKPTVSFENADGIIDSGTLDSLEFMNLITKLNEEFEIEIDVDDIIPDNFNTVEAMEAMIRRIRGLGSSK